MDYYNIYYGDSFVAWDAEFQGAFFGPWVAPDPAKPTPPDKKEADCPTCERPPITHRWKGGEKLYICGSGHGWKAEDASKKDAATQAEKA